MNISLGIPEVQSGESHFIVHKINSSILAVPITHGSGRCQVEFAFVKIKTEEKARLSGRMSHKII